MLAGADLEYFHQTKYLGVLLKASRQFKCSFDQAKIKFYCSFNAMCYRAKNASSELVCVQLLKSIVCLSCCMQLKFCHLLKQILLGWTMRSNGRCLEFLAVQFCWYHLYQGNCWHFRCYRLRGMQIQELSETILYVFHGPLWCWIVLAASVSISFF